MERSHSTASVGMQILAGLIMLAGLYAASGYSYLLFHSLAEAFSVVIAYGIFMVAYNTRHLTGSNYLLFIGISYLFVASIDLTHGITYEGMGVLPEGGANVSTQLWIAARLVESVSLLLAPVFLNRKLNSRYAFSFHLLAFSLIMLSIFHWKIFPDCFIEGSGLTSFKRLSELAISMLLILAGFVLYAHRDRLDRRILQLLLASIATTIAAETAFVFYVSVYGLSNLIGHFLKIISFYLIYKALIEIGLSRPYDLLLRELKLSEKALLEQKDELQAALEKVRTLRGLLPICAWCKKIREDSGYWKQIEGYIREHSEAEFSHSICPDCAREHFTPVLENQD